MTDNQNGETKFEALVCYGPDSAERPWVRRASDDACLCLVDGEEFYNSEGDDEPFFDEDELWDYARLFAAAPDLYEALREAQAALNGAPNTEGLHNQIDAALQSARGEGS